MARRPAAAAAAAGGFCCDYVRLETFAYTKAAGIRAGANAANDDVCGVCKRPGRPGADPDAEVCDDCWPQYIKGRVPQDWTIGKGRAGGYRWWLLMSWEEKHVVMPVEISFYDVWYWHKSLSITEFPGVKAFHLLGTRYNTDFRTNSLEDLIEDCACIGYVYVYLGDVEVTRELIRTKLGEFVSSRYSVDDGASLIKPRDGDAYADANNAGIESRRARKEKQLIGQIIEAPVVIADVTAMPLVLCVLVTQYWRPGRAEEWCARKAEMDAKARERNAIAHKAAEEMGRIKSEWEVLCKQQHEIEAAIKDDEARMRTEDRGLELRETLHAKFKRDKTRLFNKTPGHFRAIREKAAATRKRNAEARGPGTTAAKKQKLS